MRNCLDNIAANASDTSADARCSDPGNWAGTTIGTAQQTREHNKANEITSISGTWADPTYDAAGNMISGPKAGAEATRLHYVYNAWNQMNMNQCYAWLFPEPGQRWVACSKARRSIYLLLVAVLLALLAGMAGCGRNERSAIPVTITTGGTAPDRMKVSIKLPDDEPESSIITADRQQRDGLDYVGIEVESPLGYVHVLSVFTGEQQIRVHIELERPIRLVVRGYDGEHVPFERRVEPGKYELVVQMDGVGGR